MKNRNIVFTVIGVLVICCCLVVVLVGGAFYLLSRAPFNIPDARLEQAYLENRTQVGDYKIIKEKSGSTNILGIKFAGNYAAYYSKDGKINDTNFMFIQIGKADAVNFMSVVSRFESQSCDVTTKTSGALSGIEYLRGSCDESAYYIFVNRNANRLIIFETRGEGPAALEKFINDYIGS